MLTMQDSNDGGVYHKCTNANFDGMVMPGVTTAPRYLVQKSTAATLDFAAVMAQAFRVYGRFEEQYRGLADSCIHAATRAWRWAENNPSVEYNQNNINRSFDPDITTGAYGDRNFSDEGFWAACELFLVTKHEKYKKFIEERLKAPISLHSWSNVQLMGYFTLIRLQNEFSSLGSENDKLIRENLLRLADELIKPVDSSAFGTVMGGRRTDFIWGSNAVAANQGMVLINAYFISRDKKYLHYALSNLDYILGRNATGYCFVTGIGSKYPMHPHHRPSVADKIEEPVPGLLSGGPNPGMQDKCNYLFKEPETAFVDQDCSYASNEIAINWNAPLVYLAAAMEVLF
jgi:endoglucanase